MVSSALYYLKRKSRRAKKLCSVRAYLGGSEPQGLSERINPICTQSYLYSISSTVPIRRSGAQTVLRVRILGIFDSRRKCLAFAFPTHPTRVVVRDTRWSSRTRRSCELSFPRPTPKSGYGKRRTPTPNEALAPSRFSSGTQELKRLWGKKLMFLADGASGYAGSSRPQRLALRAATEGVG
jgi:hypothetical protein